MELNILICGIGGQGAVFLGSFLRKFFLNQFPDSIIVGTESRGVSQREGSVVASIRIQTNPNPQTIFSPEIPPMAADIVIALEPLELLRNFPVVQKNTIILTNNEPIIPKSSVKWMFKNTTEKEASDVNSYSKPKWLIDRVERLLEAIPVKSSRRKIALTTQSSESSIRNIQIQSLSNNPQVVDLNFSTLVLEELGSSSQLNMVMLGFLSYYAKSLIQSKDLLDKKNEFFKKGKAMEVNKKAIQFGEELAKKYLELKSPSM